MNYKLTLQDLELLDTATAYNGEQHKEICGKAALELIEYKKIEKELGIDLITLFKALKNGFYYKAVNDGYPDEIRFADPINEYCGIECYIKDYGITWASVDVAYVKDYGKTWALTKEELL